MKQFLQRNWLIITILLIGAGLRFFTLYHYGYDLTLNSDDKGYRISAIELLKSGILIYHEVGVPTIHIMPGQPFLLAGIFAIFGSGATGMIVAKTVMILLGTASIFMLYLIGKEIANKATGLIAAFLYSILIPMVVINNLLLSESAFIFASLGLIYYSFKLGKSHSHFHFFLVLFFFFLALYFRVQIAIYPAILFVYLIMKKYPWKKMMIQLVMSIGVTLIVLGPWWIRNYQQFDRFIFLTNGSGDPLLLGTYQGSNPPDTMENYYPLVNNIMEEHKNKNFHTIMDAEKEVAKKRIKQWWHDDKVGFLKTYLYEKPRILWREMYYPIPILGVTKEHLLIAFKFMKYITVLSVLTLLFVRTKNRKEFFFLGLFVFANTMFTSMYVSLPRYNLPLLPIMLVFIAYFFVLATQVWKEKRAKGKGQEENKGELLKANQ